MHARTHLPEHLPGPAAGPRRPRRKRALPGGPILLGAALLLPFLSVPGTAAAQSAREHLLVTPEWLADHLEDSGLVLLHVGPEEEYRTEHIPGARFVELGDLSAPQEGEGGLALQMPDPATLARTLGSLGISNDSRVVVYHGTDWVTPATRVLFTLDWIGLGERSSLLDGGMPLWKAEGHPVSADPPPSAEDAQVSPRVRPELVATAEWVNEHRATDGYALLDARTTGYYDGTQATNLNRQPVRKGHIPGAASVPFSEMVDERLRLKGNDELERIFAEAGVRPGDTVVTYCHIGQQASLVLFGARLLGHPVKLYDGSFQEWGSREDLPVAGSGGRP